MESECERVCECESVSVCVCVPSKAVQDVWMPLRRCNTVDLGNSTCQKELG